MSHAHDSGASAVDHSTQRRIPLIEELWRYVREWRVHPSDQGVFQSVRRQLLLIGIADDHGSSSDRDKATWAVKRRK